MSTVFPNFFYFRLDFFSVLAYDLTILLKGGFTMGLGNKEIMANNIKYYLKLYNKTPSDICKLLGFPAANFSDWINAKSNPRIDKIELMANYFGISKSDLVELKTDDNKYYESDETREIAQEIFEKPELRSLFDVAKDIPPERLKAHIEFMKSLKESEK